MLDFFKKLAMGTVRRKIKELHQAGNSVDQIVAKFYERGDVVQGFNALGITPEKFREIVEREIK